MALRLVSLLSAAVMLSATQARADGNGVLLGDGARLHLSFETEARYDSLAALGGIGTAANPTFDPSDLLLHFRPGARLLAPGANVDFTAGTLLDYTFFTGLGGPTRDLSFLGVNADATLALGRDGPLGFTLADHFLRSDQTQNPALGVGTLTDTNSLDARILGRPGGGALELGLGYSFGIEQYELHAAGNIVCSEASCNGALYGNFGSQTHTLLGSAKWRFLPKTAVFIEGSVAARQYQSASANIGTTPLHIEGGLVGLITEKVRVLIKGGYGDAFVDSGQNFAGALGQLEMTWQPQETASFSVGALRDIDPVSDVYGYYVDWRGYLSAKLLAAGRVQLTASATVDRLDFANVGRGDTVEAVNAAVEVEVTRNLRSSIGGVVTNRDSSLGGAFNYQRNEAYLRVSWAY